jgi:hypothetical protein
MYACIHTYTTCQRLVTRHMQTKNKNKNGQTCSRTVSLETHTWHSRALSTYIVTSNSVLNKTWGTHTEKRTVHTANKLRRRKKLQPLCTPFRWFLDRAVNYVCIYCFWLWQFFAQTRVCTSPLLSLSKNQMFGFADSSRFELCNKFGILAASLIFTTTCLDSWENFVCPWTGMSQPHCPSSELWMKLSSADGHGEVWIPEGAIPLDRRRPGRQVLQGLRSISTLSLFRCCCKKRTSLAGPVLSPIVFLSSSSCRRRRVLCGWSAVRNAFVKKRLFQNRLIPSSK